jgi:alanyl-tRNA synthetase
MSNSINDVRRVFLGYFGAREHTVVESASLIPVSDPTLLFVNSGMAPFKNVFTGLENRSYKRATTAQKCVRLGGKHNDLDNVGFTARHHTFFEMLGNFSFGDYFKAYAIENAWNLLTREFGLPAEKLLVTVYHTDQEAADIWKKVAGISDSRIIRISNDDNFWRMGDTGPCGPSSEIFFDHGDHIAGGPPGSPDQDGDRFVEIWNLVFMQFNQVDADTLEPLPKPCIDTGSGLERLAAALQGKHDNFDTDLFRALITASADLTGIDPDGPQRTSHRVVADHLRAASFLIADGVVPSNEGRGYVLRRVMRRAMRHAHLLGTREPMMHRLVPELVNQMGAAYPELVDGQRVIAETLRVEEQRFQATLERGLKLLDDEVARLPAGAPLPGDAAFKLYDTFGFPLDLTQDALRLRHIQVDVEGFNEAMLRQKKRARDSWAGSGDTRSERVWFDLMEEFGASEFVGYETETATCKVTAMVVDDARVEQAEAGAEVQFLLSQTPFYAASGGQVGDIGIATHSGGLRVAVLDTVKELGSLWVHRAKVEHGTFKVGDVVDVEVDAASRAKLRANHSATHLLHESLRRRLGDHVSQKGSLVTADRLRFDFSHGAALTPDDLIAVENEVNANIRANVEVVTRTMNAKDALAVGARALFGEKYGDEVRVVSMGQQDDDAKSFSVEFCGGTHVRRTGDIGVFKIVSEGSIGSGVRRIEAYSGTGAMAYLRSLETMMRKVGAIVGATIEDALESRVRQLVEQLKTSEHTIKQLRMEKLGTMGARAEATMVGDVKMYAHVGEWPARELKQIAEGMKKSVDSGVVVVVSSAEGKASIVVAVTSDLSGRLSAVDLVKAAAQASGGSGGGGRADMAQAGGPDASNPQAIVASIAQAIGQRAGSNSALNE